MMSTRISLLFHTTHFTRRVARVFSGRKGLRADGCGTAMRVFQRRVKHAAARPGANPGGQVMTMKQRLALPLFLAILLLTSMPSSADGAKFTIKAYDKYGALSPASVITVHEEYNHPTNGH